MPPHGSVKHENAQHGNPEALSEEPNLVEEYANEVISFMGVEDTLEGHRRRCPHAKRMDEGQISQQDQNDFAIRMINFAGKSIKEEHMPYFTDRLSSMGIESKVKVREPAQEDTEEKQQHNTSRDNEKVVNDAHTKPVSEHMKGVKTPKTAEPDAGFEEAHALAAEDEHEPDLVLGEEKSSVVNTELGDAIAAEMSINEWMDCLEEEYIEFQKRTSQTEAVEIRADIDEPIHASDLSAVAVVEKQDLFKGEATDSPDTSSVLSEEFVDVGLPSPTEGRESTEKSIAEVKDHSTIPADLESENNSTSALVEVENDEPYEIDFRPEDDPSVRPIEAEPSLVPEQDQGPKLYIPESLADALDIGDIKTSLDARHSVEQESGQLGVAADVEFITQIEDYLLQLEEINATESEAVLEEEAYLTQDINGVPELAVPATSESPRQAFIGVLETSYQFQELNARIEALKEQGQDKENSEDVAMLNEEQEELQEKLYEICEQFLESIGVEPSEEKVQALMERVLKIDYKTLEKDYKFTPQELSKLGTHEYRLGDWLSQKTDQVITETENSFHKIIGFFAIKGRGLSAESIWS